MLLIHNAEDETLEAERERELAREEQCGDVWLRRIADEQAVRAREARYKRNLKLLPRFAAADI